MHGIYMFLPFFLFSFFLEMSLFPSIVVPVPFFSSHVFPFRMVFFYLVTTGWIFDIMSLLHDPGVWYSTVRGGGCRFMAAFVKEEEKASKHWQRKIEAEEADKVEVAPRVTVASLRRFRAALIGPTQGLPKPRRQRNLKP